MSEKKEKVEKKEKSEKVSAKKVIKKKTTKPVRSARKFDYKTWGYVALAVVALLVVIWAILKFNQTERIDSSYFHNNNNKIVLTMDKEIAALEDSEYEAPITHVVYFHDGKNVTGAKAYYEYATEADAKKAYDNLGLGEFAVGKALNGRFIVFQLKSERYEGLTVEELENDIELLKQIDALILDYDEYTILNYVEADTTEEESENESAEPDSKSAESGSGAEQ